MQKFLNSLKPLPLVRIFYFNLIKLLINLYDIGL